MKYIHVKDKQSAEETVVNTFIEDEKLFVLEPKGEESARSFDANIVFVNDSTDRVVASDFELKFSAT